MDFILFQFMVKIDLRFAFDDMRCDEYDKVRFTSCFTAMAEKHAYDRKIAQKRNFIMKSGLLIFYQAA